MPVDFPSVDDGSRDEPYWTVEECAQRLHVSRSTIRAKFREGIWPHVIFSKRYYMSARQLASVVRLQTIDHSGVETCGLDGQPNGIVGEVIDPDSDGGVQ